MPRNGRRPGPACLVCLCACLSFALLAHWCSAFVAAKRGPPPLRLRSETTWRPPPRMQRASLSREFVEDERQVAKQVDPEEAKQRFRALSVLLLQCVDKAKDILASESHDSYITFDEFQDLLPKLDLVCSSADARALFDMMDIEKAGRIRVTELRSRVRNSGAITEMYQDGLQNVALTLVPAFALAVGFFYFKGPSSGLDFLTGYIVEDSLSVDNLFVFLLLFKYFKVPPGLQNFCLNVGIYGAVVLRAIFIFLGLAAIKAFEPLLLIFSGFLVYSSFKALTAGDDDEDEGPSEIALNIMGYLPTTPDFHGDKLFIRNEKSGGWLATPLALCIIAIELSDVLFAVDSIPAVFAVTEDPLIVFTSNIAAILGLRSLYQVLSIAVQDLKYLDKAVAVVLGFVGLKLAGEVADYEIDSFVSLCFIVFTLAVGIAASLLEASGDQQEDHRQS